MDHMESFACSSSLCLLPSACPKQKTKSRGTKRDESRRFKQPTKRFGGDVHSSCERIPRKLFIALWYSLPNASTVDEKNRHTIRHYTSATGRGGSTRWQTTCINRVPRPHHRCPRLPPTINRALVATQKKCSTAGTLPSNFENTFRVFDRPFIPLCPGGAAGDINVPVEGTSWVRTPAKAKEDIFISLVSSSVAEGVSMSKSD